MRTQEQVNEIVRRLLAEYPEAVCALDYDKDYELLFSVRLSAQCTDARVNMVTPALFAAYPTVSDLAKATEEEVLAYVKSVSYPNSKSKHLVQMAQMAVTDFNGEIPSTMEELTQLPGVGRKTANVVLAFAFDQAAMPVDTHVFRVAHRLGLVPDSAKTPDAVEKVLVKNFPKEYISRAHHWLLLHGRYVCTARKPHCEECPLSPICPSPKLLTTNC